ncbi:MAG: DUF1674 domain-containing protein [Wenzhouxiangellaceae bacterium]|nr:DUF1674 domain-containing protein [Wenzhouxiangellaceae bacterium]
MRNASKVSGGERVRASRPEDVDRAPEQGPGHDVEGSGKSERPREIGGRPGPDPTRYGDWEKNGRCIDF